MATSGPFLPLAFIKNAGPQSIDLRFTRRVGPTGYSISGGKGLLDDAEEVACDDLVTAASVASSKHPELTAEIWSKDKKLAVVRPCPPNARKR